VLGKSALNPNFDTVEAWKHGPVIHTTLRLSLI
jgi:uncharacterized phage-associated protein